MSEVLALTYGYTAKDLAAVRAYVQRVAPAIIARTYYDSYDDSFAATPFAMERKRPAKSGVSLMEGQLVSSHAEAIRRSCRPAVLAVA